ncbi:hypothetical protein [Umezakia ovalisporum]|uniref:hypothetical protein n=1 Tax=Umezakia ovalisporum TaxID=75695 RepID=UPI002475C145|nr:hypothetical protein [Umezakia ovalisporum]MDH6089602.1 hypothetical protein [Umezakia ovalisporum Ak1311]
MAKDKVAKKPAFLLRGIQEAWIPSENYDKNVELSIFNDWYNLPYSLKILSAATTMEELQYILTKEK